MKNQKKPKEEGESNLEKTTEVIDRLITFIQIVHEIK